jgi:hypothetical protein
MNPVCAKCGNAVRYWATLREHVLTYCQKTSTSSTLDTVTEVLFSDRFLFSAN